VPFENQRKATKDMTGKYDFLNSKKKKTNK
jgi:hypothetical protein